VIMQCRAISSTKAQKAFSSKLSCTHAELALDAACNQHNVDVLDASLTHNVPKLQPFPGSVVITVQDCGEHCFSAYGIVTTAAL